MVRIIKILKKEVIPLILWSKKYYMLNQGNNLFILIPFRALLALGLVMVSSASIFIADEMTGNPFHFVSRQMLFIAIGLMAMLFFMLLPSDFLFKLDWVFMLLSIILLIVLFIPEIGTSVNGSIRWIRLGPINIQPSEICKFSLILYISGYSVRRLSEIDTFRSFLKPLMLLFIISILIMGQPDLGSTAIICLLVVSILFYAGISFFQFSMLSSMIALLGFVAITRSPMRIARVMSYMDPFDKDVVLNSGYQLSNSLISIGQGGWLGLGLGNSFQKDFFLPEAHTDFIFAILVEELGVVGGLFLLGLFVVLFIGILRVSLDSFSKERLFQGYVTYGILILIAAQSLFNIAVNIGLLPTKGLTLPFISYGGTSIIIMMSLIGIVLRINNENKLI